MDVYNETKKCIKKGEQKQRKNVISYPNVEACDSDIINVFVLYSDINRRYVAAMEKRLSNKKIVLTKGLAGTDMIYDRKINIIDNFDFVVVIISEVFLEDLHLLDILVENYEINEKNEKILPIILWKDLYEPEVKVEVTDKLQERIHKYQANNFNNDFDGTVAEELRRMQKILKMLGDFIKFATERDRVKNLHGSDKLLKYIQHERGIEVADKDYMGKVGHMELEKKIVLNVKNGGQVIVADGHADVKVTQNNGIDANELENIVKGIMENLSGLQQEEADKIGEVVRMVKKEVTKQEPSAGNLRKCLPMFADLFTIASGVPILMSSLHKLQEFINLHI